MPAHRALELVEAGDLSLCYFSTSYLSARVPEIAVLDLPYLFASPAQARRCLDGDLGQALSRLTAERTALKPVGYWDNGVRHLSTRVRPVKGASDLEGQRIRLQPNWAHEMYFSLLGAQPVAVDLRLGIEMIKAGSVDAQENPLANFVTYGVDRVHPHLTLSGHAFGARGVYLSQRQVRDWPDGVLEVVAEAVTAAVGSQRREAQELDAVLLGRLRQQGINVLELDAAALEAFRQPAQTVLDQARANLGADLLGLVR